MEFVRVCNRGIEPAISFTIRLSSIRVGQVAAVQYPGRRDYHCPYRFEGEPVTYQWQMVQSTGLLEGRAAKRSGCSESDRRTPTATRLKRPISTTFVWRTAREYPIPSTLINKAWKSILYEHLLVFVHIRMMITRK